MRRYLRYGSASHAVGGSGQCTTLPGHMADLFFFSFRTLSHTDWYVSSRGFIFSIYFIPSVYFKASASGVGTPDRTTTMMRWYHTPDRWVFPTLCVTYIQSSKNQADVVLTCLPYIGSTGAVPL